MSTRKSKHRRVDPSAPTALTGPTLIAVPSLTAAGSGAQAREAAEALERRFRPVWDLADGGQPPEAIARETGHPIGQVELILALRRQAGAAVTHG